MRNIIFSTIISFLAAGTCLGVPETIFPRGQHYFGAGKVFSGEIMFPAGARTFLFQKMESLGQKVSCFRTPEELGEGRHLLEVFRAPCAPPGERLPNLLVLCWSAALRFNLSPEHVFAHLTCGFQHTARIAALCQPGIGQAAAGGWNYCGKDSP